MNPFDLAVPKNLKEVQCWFGGVIGQPMSEDHRICEVAPSGRCIAEEALEYILPSKALSAKERIQLYNQQFWWRFFNALQEQFPFVTRLFGLRDFDQEIAVPYLTKYRPHRWLLRSLGEDLPKWITEEYKGNDFEIVYDAALLDLTNTQSFIAAHLPALGKENHGEGDPESLFKKIAYLQPHLFLFEKQYDVFSLRNQFLEHDPGYWLVHDFPKYKKDRVYYFVFFRTVYNSLVYEEIDEAEYRLLERFRFGSSIEKAIEWIEKQPKQLQDATTMGLNRWIEKWIVNEWLTS